MKQSTLLFYKERMLKVLVQIQEQVDAPLPLEKLAMLAGLAPHHFHHVFTGMLGESLAAHIRRLRLERAASRLKLSRMPVIQIALEAGYDSHEAFSRAFRTTFGLAPRVFRRRHSPVGEAPARSGVHYQENRCPANFAAARKEKMNVTIKQIPAMRVAFMRHTGPYLTVGETWEKLMMFCGKEGLMGGETQCIGICHDDPAVTPPEKIRYDACVTVDAGFQPAGEVAVQTIAGGEYAVTTHFGSYNRLGETYARLLGQWLPRSGRHLGTTPCFEVYLNSPESAEPEDLLTDVYAPLEPENTVPL